MSNTANGTGRNRANAGASVMQSESSLNPEEYVRQYVLRLLFDTFKFSKSDVEIEFPIKLGSSKKRADIVVFYPGSRHNQTNIYIIVECKRADRRDDTAAVQQLESYLSACINATYGVAATYRWRVLQKTVTNGRYTFNPISALVDAKNLPVKIDYHPEVWRTRSQSRTTVGGSVTNLKSVLRYGTIMFIVFSCFVLFGVMSNSRPRNSAPPPPRTVGQNLVPTATARAQAVINQIQVRPTATNLPPTRIPPSATFTPRSTLQIRPLLSQTATLHSTRPPTLSPPHIITAAPYTTPDRVIGTINAEQNVNLRQSPSTDAAVIMSLRPGTLLEVLGESDDHSWVQVRLDSGETGWVAARLVTVG